MLLLYLPPLHLSLELLSLSYPTLSWALSPSLFYATASGHLLKGLTVQLGVWQQTRRRYGFYPENGHWVFLLVHSQPRYHALYISQPRIFPHLLLLLEEDRKEGFMVTCSPRTDSLLLVHNRCQSITSPPRVCPRYRYGQKHSPSAGGEARAAPTVPGSLHGLESDVQTES